MTVWLVWTLLGWVDSFVWPFVPAAYHPDALVNRILGHDPGSPQWVAVNIRGVGVVIFLVFTVLVGWITKGLVGRSLISWGEDLVARLPFVRSIYSALKQVAESIFAQDDAKFDRMCLVQFPRKDTWSVGFIAPEPRGEIRARLGALWPDDPVMAVYLPTTPNPTTGYLMWCRKSEIIELDMGVEDAAKLVISAGLVYPGDRQQVEAALGLKGDTPE
ncbi:MAG: DUF502 domain-containing protein [Rubellimicrobium sp.]|nr:DUF502 domain-containing protein [Rubellimicrobium sp.]